MFNITPKIIETLLADESLVEDFDEVATRCIVGLHRNMADLNVFLLSTRGKKVTDKRREVSTQILSNLLFYTAILIHLNDLPPDLFDMDADAEENAVVDMTTMFGEEYFHSPLLLGNHMMGICADIGEHMWSEKFDQTEDEVPEELAVPALGTKDLEIPDSSAYNQFMSTVLGGMQEEGAPEDDTFGNWDVDNDAEPMIARFLAGLMIMADLCDIDLGVCMYNASQQTEI